LLSLARSAMFTFVSAPFGVRSIDCVVVGFVAGALDERVRRGRAVAHRVDDLPHGLRSDSARGANIPPNPPANAPSLTAAYEYPGLVEEIAAGRERRRCGDLEDRVSVMPAAERYTSREPVSLYGVEQPLKILMNSVGRALTFRALRRQLVDHERCTTGADTQIARVRRIGRRSIPQRRCRRATCGLSRRRSDRRSRTSGIGATMSATYSSLFISNDGEIGVPVFGAASTPRPPSTSTDRCRPGRCRPDRSRGPIGSFPPGSRLSSGDEYAPKHLATDPMSR
jgi:hypothetical protein